MYCASITYIIYIVFKQSLIYVNHLQIGIIVIDK